MPLAEQGAVAGVITSANGISYVLAPALGIGLYGWHHDLPFAAFALLLVGAGGGRPRPLVRLGLCRPAFGPQHPGKHEADAAERPRRVALQRLLDLLIFLEHLGA